MSHKTSATVILNSITPHGPETQLTSIYAVFPKMILGERNRHRGFSLSDRSSRAVPSAKLIEEVRTDPAMPARFRKHQAGMSGGEEMTSRPIHASPTEHQATPDHIIDMATTIQDHVMGRKMSWVNPHEHGNLYGWRQARKTIFGEAVADLPEGYSL
jgi:hypothetical protein